MNYSSNNERYPLSKISLTLATILAAAIVVTIAGTTNAEANEPVRAEQTPYGTRPSQATMKLDRSISLLDAAAFSSNSGLRVLGYRYENPGIVGEFYNTMPVEQFVSEFRKLNGTDPQVVALIVNAGGGATDYERRASPQQSIPVPDDIVTFSAPPAVGGSISEKRISAQNRASSLEAAKSGIAAIAPTFQPSYSQYETFNQNGRAKIWEDHIWAASYSSPLNRDLTYGLEFEVNQ